MLYSEVADLHFFIWLHVITYAKNAWTNKLNDLGAW